MTRQFFLPLSFVFDRVTRLRNHFYDSGRLDIKKVRKPVVSVGNLSVGGTGKTPFVLGLVAWAKTGGLSPGVVSRGYKSANREARRVEASQTDAAHLFGDEPTLIAEKYSDVPVYVGVDRFAVAEKLIAENAVDFIILDDGFQHRRLYRDLDIVLIDALSKLKNEPVLPAGNLRESPERLRQAHFIVITRANLVDEKILRQIHRELDELGVSKAIRIEDRVEVKRVLEWRPSSAELSEVSQESASSACVLISGLGRPKSFEAVAASIGIKCLKHFTFPDHHDYTEDDLLGIVASGEAKKARAIVTTEKDYVKLRDLQITKEDLKDLRIFIIEIENKLSSTVEDLQNAIIRLVR